MRMIGWIAGACLAAAVPLAALAAPDVDDLAQTMKLAEITEILRDEGYDYAGKIEADLLDGSGGALWQARVAELYDPARLQAALKASMARTMTDDDVAAAIDFFGSGRGQSILDYENAARRGMSDPAVEEAATARVADLVAADDAHLARVRDFVDANDLLERNVAGALSSNYQFLRGMADSGGIEMSEADIVSDVWGQEGAVRIETEVWLMAFLVLAYAPLSAEDLEDYTRFSLSPAGRALNAALFDGFEELYREISYTLGLMVGQEMQGSDL